MPGREVVSVAGRKLIIYVLKWENVNPALVSISGAVEIGLLRLSQ